MNDASRAGTGAAIRREVEPDGTVVYHYPYGKKRYKPVRTKGPKTEGRTGWYYQNHWIDRPPWIADELRVMPETRY